MLTHESSDLKPLTVLTRQLGYAELENNLLLDREK